MTEITRTDEVLPGVEVSSTVEIPEGYYEWVRYPEATSHFAVVGKNGYLYLPDSLSEDLNEAVRQFCNSYSTGHAHRLVRVETLTDYADQMYHQKVRAIRVAEHNLDMLKTWVDAHAEARVQDNPVNHRRSLVVIQENDQGGTDTFRVYPGDVLLQRQIDKKFQGKDYRVFKQNFELIQ